MKKQISRISILQSSKIVVALYVLFGLLYTLVGIPLFIFGNDKLKVMAVLYIAMPVIMGVVGFIFFAASAWVYNVLANMVGGIEVEVTNVEETQLP